MPCGVIGTLGGEFGAQPWPLSNTTPLALELHALLAAQRDAGAKAVAMEVSSHALALQRVDHVALRRRGAHEHHARPPRLSRHDGPLRRREAPAVRPRAGRGRQRRRSVGRKAFGASCRRAPVRRCTTTSRANRTAAFAQPTCGSRATARRSASATRDVVINLPGRFNVRNALAAFGVGIAAAGSTPTTSRAAWPRRAPCPGRMERIGAFGIDAIVDYAHTPDALENVLHAARETTRGDLIVVFGCGGDRDPGKRTQMGEIAARIADRVIVTSDNPRSEDPLDDRAHGRERLRAHRHRARPPRRDPPRDRRSQSGRHRGRRRQRPRNVPDRRRPDAPVRRPRRSPHRLLQTRRVGRRR